MMDREIQSADGGPTSGVGTMREWSHRLLVILACTAVVATVGCADDEENGFQNDVDHNSAIDAGTDSSTEPDATEPDADVTDDADAEPGEVDPMEEPPIPGENPGWVGGHSVEERPVVVEHFGEEGPVLFVLSAIHGDERLAVIYGERFRTELNAGFASRHGIQVVFMQATNPDGIEAYSRHNANGIDLNRNFPTANFNPGGPGGDTALSEPEAEAIRDAVDASGLTSVLTLHCCVPGFDYDGPGGELAQVMSEAMDPDHRFDVLDLGAASGSLGSYVGLEMERPIITVEFARFEDFDPFIQLDEMDHSVGAAADWTADNPSGEVLEFGDMTTEDTWSYRSDYPGESAGGIPLRVESIGEPGDERFVLLSGLDGELKTGPWIAEHIRRELLGLPQLDADHWQIVTAANPDGIADRSRTNDDGVDIAADVADEVSTTTEASVVLDLLDEAPATVFLVTNSGDGDDRVHIVGADDDELEEQIPVRFSQDSEPENTELADSLADRGFTVVQIDVGTENLEAQSQDGGFADGLDSPFDFGEMVFEMAGL